MKNKFFASLAVGAVLFVGIILTGRYDFYDSYPHFDDVMHFMGGLVMAWFISTLLWREEKIIPRFSYGVLLIGCVAIVGIAWEILEYTSGTHSASFAPLLFKYFHGGDLYDTLSDLALDLLGAFLFTAFYLRRR